jgi:hypothetical protein
LKTLTLIILAGSTTLLSADAPKPPAISDALKAQFFKAQAQFIQAQAAAAQAQEAAKEKNTAYTDAVSAIQKACGEGFQAQMDDKSDPACVVAPKAPENPVENK